MQVDGQSAVARRGQVGMHHPWYFVLGVMVAVGGTVGGYLATKVDARGYLLPPPTSFDREQSEDFWKRINRRKNTGARWLAGIILILGPAVGLIFSLR